MKHAIVFLMLMGFGSIWGDSLLDSTQLAQNNAYSPRSKPRLEYDYRIHDTVLIDISIQDTLEFTRKLDTQRQVGWGAKIKSFITDFSLGKQSLPNVEVESESDFKADGKKSDVRKVRIKIPAEVVEILPNGDLILDAKRTVWVGEDSANVHMGGRVNPKFIKNDTVPSEPILGLYVRTESKGPLNDNEKRGFLTRFFDMFKPF